MGVNSRAGLAGLEAPHARSHQRRAHGERRHDRRPGHHLHRRRRLDRSRHRDPPHDVPRGGHLDRLGLRDRPVGAPDRHRGGGPVPGELRGGEPRGAGRGRRRGTVRLPPARGRTRRWCPRGQLRRDQGLHGGTRLEGAAPVVRGRCHDRRGHQHRCRHRVRELRRLRQTSDQGRRRRAHRVGYDAGGAGVDRRRRRHGSRFGDHEGRPGRSVRGGARGAAHRRGLPRTQGRSARRLPDARVGARPPAGPGIRRGSGPWRSSPRSG